MGIVVEQFFTNTLLQVYICSTMFANVGGFRSKDKSKLR